MVLMNLKRLTQRKTYSFVAIRTISKRTHLKPLLQTLWRVIVCNPIAPSVVFMTSTMEILFGLELKDVTDKKRFWIFFDLAHDVSDVAHRKSSCGLLGHPNKKRDFFGFKFSCLIVITSRSWLEVKGNIGQKGMCGQKVAQPRKAHVDALWVAQNLGPLKLFCNPLAQPYFLRLLTLSPWFRTRKKRFEFFSNAIMKSRSPAFWM